MPAAMTAPLRPSLTGILAAARCSTRAATSAVRRLVPPRPAEAAGGRRREGGTDAGRGGSSAVERGLEAEDGK